MCFAELKDPVKDKLKRFGLFPQFGERLFFARVGEAVDEYQRLPEKRVEAPESRGDRSRPPLLDPNCFGG